MISFGVEISCDHFSNCDEKTTAVAKVEGDGSGHVLKLVGAPPEGWAIGYRDWTTGRSENNLRDKTFCPKHRHERVSK